MLCCTSWPWLCARKVGWARRLERAIQSLMSLWVKKWTMLLSTFGVSFFFFFAVVWQTSNEARGSGGRCAMSWKNKLSCCAHICILRRNTQLLPTQFRPSVSLCVRHAGGPRQNGLRYRDTVCTERHDDVKGLSAPNFAVVIVFRGHVLLYFTLLYFAPMTIYSRVGFSTVADLMV